MKRLHDYFRNFLENERGAITMEFVMIAPVLAGWLLISYSFFDGFKTYMRANKATYTAIDLISRQDVVNDAYITTVGSIFESIVDSDGTDPTMAITSILQVDANTKRIQWSTALNGGTRIFSEDELPLNVIPNMVIGESLILIQTGVAFEPHITFAKLKATTFKNEVAVTPRFHPEITNTDQINGPVRDVNDHTDQLNEENTGGTRS